MPNELLLSPLWKEMEAVSRQRDFSPLYANLIYTCHHFKNGNTETTILTLLCACETPSYIFYVSHNNGGHWENAVSLFLWKILCSEKVIEELGLSSQTIKVASSVSILNPGVGWKILENF